MRNQNKSNGPFNFLLIGRSGCGKGTQAKLIAKYLEDNDLGEVLYVYTGERLRGLVQKYNTQTAKIAKEIMLSGGIEPSFLSVWAWSEEFINNVSKNINIIIDGAPRVLIEAKIIDEAFNFYGRERVEPIFIETGREWAAQRLLERGRIDDKKEAIEERLNFFDRMVIPVIDYYEKESKHKLIRVNGEQSIENVHKEILKKCF